MFSRDRPGDEPGAALRSGLQGMNQPLRTTHSVGGGVSGRLGSTGLPQFEGEDIGEAASAVERRAWHPNRDDDP